MPYRILVVDDIFVNRLLLIEILKKIPAEYKEAENGKIALELLKQENFDAIFMDIEMPVMNGIETTRCIRTALPFPKNQVPIIAITAHNPINFFVDYKEVGFTDLITKPYSVEKIARIVERSCGVVNT